MVTVRMRTWLRRWRSFQDDDQLAHPLLRLGQPMPFPLRLAREGDAPQFGAGEQLFRRLPLGLLLWYPFFMGKPIKGTTKKRRGRPATTGRGTQIGMRWQEPQLSAIDSWMEKHDVATRPEAIRRLVGLGLQAKK